MSCIAELPRREGSRPHAVGHCGFSLVLNRGLQRRRCYTSERRPCVGKIRKLEAGDVSLIARAQSDCCELRQKWFGIRKSTRPHSLDRRSWRKATCRLLEENDISVLRSGPNSCDKTPARSQNAGNL